MLKNLFFVCILVAATVPFSTAQSASFNCRYAKLAAEIAICQSRELHILDEKMAGKYVRLKQHLGGAVWRNLRNEQRHWQRRRNNCGYDNICIEDSYVYRIRALNHWLYEYNLGG